MKEGVVFVRQIALNFGPNTDDAYHIDMQRNLEELTTRTHAANDTCSFTPNFVAAELPLTLM